MMRKIAGMLVLLALAAFLAGCAQLREGGGELSAVGQGTESQTTQEGARSYTVMKIEGDPDWESIPAVDIDNQQWLDPIDITAHAQLCYDDEAFYVRMWAEEADIRAEYPVSDLLANTYEDSCLEFFIAPVQGDSRYMNFEINPNCAMGVQIGSTKEDRTRLVRTDDMYHASSTRTEDGWEVTYRIPFQFVRQFYPGFEAQSGDVLKGNFYKCGNLTTHKHYLSWNPIASDTPNFHVPESFGDLVLA